MLPLAFAFMFVETVSCLFNEFADTDLTASITIWILDKQTN